MAQAQADTLSSLDQLDVVVDADAHVSEKFEDVLPHIDGKYEALRDRMAGESRPWAIVSSATQAGPSAKSKYEETRDADTKVRQLGEFGIDYGVLLGTRFNGINTVNNPRFAVALADGFNNWMLEDFLDDEALRAGIIIAPKKPHRAAEEIDDRADEDGFVGVAMPPAGLLPPLGHEQYDPIYEAAEDNGLPLMLHGTNRGFQWDHPVLFQWSETKAETHFVSHPFQQMWQLGTSLYRGLPERYPDLDLVFQECGVAHIAYMKWRLDDIYLEKSQDVPLLDRLPSEYIDENYYFTTQPLGHTAKDPSHLAKAIELAGPGNILYASDLPHSTFDPPEELFDRIHRHFDAEVVRGMMGETALDVFDI